MLVSIVRAAYGLGRNQIAIKAGATMTDQPIEKQVEAAWRCTNACDLLTGEHDKVCAAFYRPAVLALLERVETRAELAEKTSSDALDEIRRLVALLERR